MLWVGFAYAAWLAGLLFLAVTVSELSDPLLWPSWRYEPAAIVLLIGALTLLSTVVAARIVTAAQPIGSDDAKAAILDDARRVGAAQRLAAATLTAGLVASLPTARLLLARDAQSVIGLAASIMVAFWIAVPGTTNTLHRRWVAMMSHSRVVAA